MSVSPEPRPESVEAPEPSASELEVATTESLPVPVGPLRSQLTLPRAEAAKPSLWKRIRMRKRNTDASPVADNGDLAARLDAIEHKLDLFDTTLAEQFQAIEARLEEVWQSEEQLSHLADIQDKLDRLAQSHVELTTGVASLRRTVIGLSALVILAAAASGLIYSSLFQ
ncbi:MAG: hypothetical protein GY733_25295 [bacterium]|nr:hypothetical protein [bacterium]